MWKLLFSFTFDADKEIRAEMLTFLRSLEKHEDESSLTAFMSRKEEIIKDNLNSINDDVDKERRGQIRSSSSSSSSSVKPRDLLKRVSDEALRQTPTSDQREMVALAMAALVPEDVDQEGKQLQQLPRESGLAAAADQVRRIELIAPYIVLLS